MRQRNKVLIVVTSLMLWLIVICVHCIWHVRYGIDSAGSDTYAKNEGYQFIVFWLLVLPYYLAALVPLLVLDAFIINYFKRNN